LLIFIILGGIYNGWFTPTEGAAVAAVYAFFIAIFIYQDLKFRDLPKVFIDSAKVTIMLMFIIINAMLFGHVLTTEQIPQQLAAVLINAGMTPGMFLLVINILLLIGGSFMEPSGLLLILTPIFYPISQQLGIDPIHLGIIIVVNMEIGMLTPPVGLNLFVISGITGMPLITVVRAVIPWLLILLLFLVIVTYLPEISLFLPDLVYGPQQ